MFRLSFCLSLMLVYNVNFQCILLKIRGGKVDLENGQGPVQKYRN